MNFWITAAEFLQINEKERKNPGLRRNFFTQRIDFGIQM